MYTLAGAASFCCSARDFFLVNSRQGRVIRIKRIYDPPQSSDGCRVLVDRLWPRGVSRNQARLDLWMKEIAPSDALRKWFAHKPERWAGFQSRYRRELRARPELVRQLRRLAKERGTVTLLFSARDARHNQAVALRSFLRAGR
jgi:uncharacterized protein YeaO (DUF488 family)